MDENKTKAFLKRCKRSFPKTQNPDTVEDKYQIKTSRQKTEGFIVVEGKLLIGYYFSKRCAIGIDPNQLQIIGAVSRAACRVTV
jgi:hypothetical protein